MEELQKLMVEFEERNNISIVIEVYADEVTVMEFWNVDTWHEETLYNGPISGLIDFLKETKYKLGSDGRCLSPVQKIS